MPITEAEAHDETLSGPSSEAPPASAPGPLATGRVLGGRYEILGLLGEGGMGAVYEAEHRGIGRRVAVKVLGAGVAHDETVLRRFGAEARAAGRARHRNIVEMLDFGADGPLHWMVMERLEGEPLDAFVAREAPVDPARVTELLDPVLRALAHAHSLGIVHRDLKPGNIFLAREPGVEGIVPKVLDFGIAKSADAAAKLTRTESIIGTPAYMAPEQIESSKSVTAAADQYAMGCVAYELLTGALPFAAETLPMLILHKMTREPDPIDARRPSLPPSLAACVMRALARDPAARHPDIESFRVALRAACDDGAHTAATLDVPAPRTASVPASAPAPAPASVPAPAPAPPVEPASAPAPRSRAWMFAVVVGFAVALAAIVLRGRPSPPSPAANPVVANPVVANPVVANPVVANPVVANPVVASPPPTAAPAAPPSPRRHREARPHGRLRVDPTNPL